LLADSKDSSIGRSIPDVASGTTVGRSQATFKLTTERLTLAGGNNGEILGMRTKNDLGGVPEGRRTVRGDTSDGRSAKGRGRKKEGIITPQQRGGISTGRESDLHSLVVTRGVGEKLGRGREGSVANIHEHVINPCVNRRRVTRNTMESVIRGGGAGQSGIGKRSKNRKKIGPRQSLRRRGSGTPIANRIGISIPVPPQEIKRGKSIRLGRKFIEENDTRRARSVGINVGDLKDLPLEAKGRS